MALRLSKRKKVSGLIGLACLVGLSVAGGMAHAGSDALWRIVHGACVPHQAATGDPAPCAYVSPKGAGRGYALLKDRVGIAQFLLIPTDRVTGIEDPVLLEPGRTGYWAAAWAGRRYLEARLGGGVPRDAIGLAINSAFGRSQNQLHIHIDCVRPDVRQALKAHEAAIGAGWSTIALPPKGHRYRVKTLAAGDLARLDPFRLVADQGPDVAGDMAVQTIAVIGARFPDGRDGFYLLNDHASLAALDPASGEELLDPTCAGVASR